MSRLGELTGGTDGAYKHIAWLRDQGETDALYSVMNEAASVYDVIVTRTQGYLLVGKVLQVVKTKVHGYYYVCENYKQGCEGQIFVFPVNEGNVMDVLEIKKV
jgi:hypothetical protein